MDASFWLLISVFVSFGFSFLLNVFIGALQNFSINKLEKILPPSQKETFLANFNEKVESALFFCRFLKYLFEVIFIVTSFWYFVFPNIYSTVNVTYAVISVIAIVVVYSVVMNAISYSFGQHSAERLIRKNLLWLVSFSKIAAPLKKVYDSGDALVGRIMGDVENGNDHSVDEEILDVVSEREKEGAIEEESVDMIENIIKLRKSDVYEVMTPRTDMVYIDLTATVADAVQVIMKKGHSRIPVVNENRDNVVGILYAKDLLQLSSSPEKAEHTKVSDLMRQPFFIPETKKIGELLEEFKSQKIHIAIVLDEFGGTAGLVTIEDLVEEIVGEIEDEYDLIKELLIKKLDTNTYEVKAKVHIDELNEIASIDLPEDEDYETVAGFVFSQFGRIPQVGETFDYKNVTFTVVDADERKIKKLKVAVREEDAS